METFEPEGNEAQVGGERPSTPTQVLGDLAGTEARGGFDSRIVHHL